MFFGFIKTDGKADGNSQDSPVAENVASEESIVEKDALVIASSAGKKLAEKKSAVEKESSLAEKKDAESRKDRLKKQSNSKVECRNPECTESALYAYSGEFDDEGVMEMLAENTVIIYIQPNAADEKRLIERATAAPKPMYYRAQYFDEQLVIYMQEKNLEYVSMIVPDEFVRWVFPRLFYNRIPRYERIAQQYGYTIKSEDLYQIKTEADFLQLVEKNIAEQS